MKKKKLIMRYLKMFLLAILVFITTFAFVTRLTILNSSFILRQFSTEHYKQVETDLKVKMKESMIPSGINSRVIDDMFTYADVKKNSLEVIDIVYDYNKQNIDTSEIRKRLEEGIRKDLASKNYQVQDDDGFNNFVDSTMAIYENEFNMLKQVSTIGMYMQKIIKIMTVLAIMLGTITVIIIAVKYKKMPRYLPVALFTTSFLNLFGGMYIYKHAGLASITIISPTFSEILRKVVLKTFQTFYVVSIVYIVIGILLCFLVRRHHHHH